MPASLFHYTWLGESVVYHSTCQSHGTPPPVPSLTFHLLQACSSTQVTKSQNVCGQHNCHQLGETSPLLLLQKATALNLSNGEGDMLQLELASYFY